ncbi:DUF2785 domain-containing protein [Listeria ivanovii]|uniref:DUF2785 domain-containing protein n=1 Tax=Listeria ivanovii TaxID=1638 RepID=UPI0005128FC0|nr:DUF2785 domain-containing protein [Listeria ivanovii]AIS62537.1 hypothetical protein JL53_07315 [Listeria ivanovii subsp. londoniensis]MBK1964997.1 DUF2785 domain-containing protein [Listeria ivanovii subsp. londoniensis]MBK1984518.1 DUF2785 domain-containing protein [Listeria ivanovii subsp. londoniensis]MBK1995720.1 DUF2785 domain-containing protein [Listeria ivanovii subsp. londoniensis]
MIDNSLYNSLKLTNYQLPQNFKKAEKMINTFLTYLSSTDSKLRDKIAYSIFSEWLYTKDNLSYEQKMIIYSYALNEKNLFYKIKSIENDAVFQRSFLTLIIALLLSNNKVHNFLTAKEVQRIYISLTQLLATENDTRSFVEGKGWAHCIAHIADALDELVYQMSIKNKEVTIIMDNISSFYKRNYTILTGEEDERLSTIIITALTLQKLSYTEVKNWLISISENIPIVSPEIPLINIKQFTQTLLIKLSILEYDVKFKDFPLLTRYI